MTLDQRQHPSPGLSAPGVPGAAPGAGIRTRDVVGTSLAMTDYDGAMDAMEQMIASREPGYVCATAVHAVMVARHDAEMRRALDGAALAVPDGMPLVWAANAMGERLRDRVYGPELMRRFCDRCAERGHRVWLYGGRDPEALEQLTRELRRRHPGLDVAGGFAPPFRELTAAEEEELERRVAADRPDVMWVGIGVPKQEKWMARMLGRLDVPVMVGVGAAFDFHAGRVPQAPAWMQRYGLEWLHRLSREPRRLAPRYLRYNPAFVAAIARQLAADRRARRG